MEESVLESMYNSSNNLAQSQRSSFSKSFRTESDALSAYRLIKSSRHTPAAVFQQVLCLSLRKRRIDYVLEWGHSIE
jgi:hypothetical protein